MSLKITHSRVSRYFELTDTETSKIIEERTTTTSNPAFILAFQAYEKRPCHDVALRAWRAAKMVEAGHVDMLSERDYTGSAIASVKSEKGPKRYAIWQLEPPEPGSHRHHKHTLACGCMDYRLQNAPVINGQPACKHIIDVGMTHHINGRNVLNDFLTSLPKRPALAPGEIVDVITRSDAAYSATIHGRRKKEIFQMMNKIGTPEGDALIARAASQPQPF